MKTKGKSELAQEAAIKAVLAAGYVPDGETRSETVRMPTTDCPVVGRGKIGGELATFGGRQRFALLGTPYKVTVGQRSTNFYEFDKGQDKEAHGFKYLDTVDLEGVARTAREFRARIIDPEPTPDRFAELICEAINRDPSMGDECDVEDAKSYPAYRDSPAMIAIKFATGGKMRLHVTPVLTDKNCLLPNGEKHPGWHVF